MRCKFYLVPVLLGEGVRLFEDFGHRANRTSERTKSIETPSATHLWFEVVK
jgi:hypothetical protein